MEFSGLLSEDAQTSPNEGPACSIAGKGPSIQLGATLLREESKNKRENIVNLRFQAKATRSRFWSG